MTQNHLHDLESQSVYIIREAYALLDPLAALWSMGKDSTVLLWLIRKAFYGRVPFPVVLLDTGMEMDEVYAFRDRLAREWPLDIINHACPPLEEMDTSLPPAARAAARKTAGLKTLLADKKFSGIFCGIRRDEQGVRSKERIFSPRDAGGAWDVKNQPAELWMDYQMAVPPGGHLRIHPLLDWSEKNIWEYIRKENIPVCDLYFAREGRRYRSLGEKNITMSVASEAATIDAIIAELETTSVAERAGRASDDETESSFEQLRTQGYM